jgi:hypothetical protein
VAPGYALSLAGTYQPKGDIFAEDSVRTSPLDASREDRAHEAEVAEAWFKSLTGDAFG